MRNTNDVNNDSWFRKVLGDLGKETHIPPEIILADVRGDLTEDAHEIVASHIRECGDCRKLFDFSRESLGFENRSMPLQSESELTMHERIESKTTLLAQLNAKRDCIAERIAKLLLPEKSWFSIRPTIAVARNLNKTSAPNHSEETRELAASALSGSARIEDKQSSEITRRILTFVTLVNDHLLECCDSQSEVTQKLPECIDEAMTVMADIRLDKPGNEEISKVMLESWVMDERQL